MVRGRPMTASRPRKLSNRWLYVYVHVSSCPAVLTSPEWHICRPNFFSHEGTKIALSSDSVTAGRAAEPGLIKFIRFRFLGSRGRPPAHTKCCIWPVFLLQRANMILINVSFSLTKTGTLATTVGIFLF